LTEQLSLAVLCVAGLGAGFVNAVAGGGSLLTLPALIFTGLDAHAANATNRIAILFQSGAALGGYHRSGARLPRQALWLALPAAGSAAAGAYLSTRVGEDNLRLILAIALVAFLCLSLFPKPKREEGQRAMPSGPLFICGICAIGFYAGFLQAGMGILTLLFLGWAHRMKLTEANVIKVYMLGCLTIFAILTFIVEGAEFDLARGVLLAASTSLGAFFGARFGVSLSDRVVQALMVTAVSASAAKLLYDFFA